MNNRSANFWCKAHLILTFQWAAHLPVVTYIFFWQPEMWMKISIFYLAVVSIYANVVSHWGAWQGARAERKADNR